MAFLLVILALAAGYTFMAFQLEWMTPAGQLGPGFFPRLIGAGLVIACLYALSWAARALRSQVPGARTGPTRDLRGMMVATGLFLWAFGALGPALAMPVFFMAVLSWWAPRAIGLNLLISAGAAGLLYALFYRWLGSPMPQGILS